MSHRGKGATAREHRLHVPVLPSGGVPPARRWTGLALAGAGLPTLTAILTASRNTLALGSVLLLYLLAVVVVAVVGGILPAVVAALASFLLANWFLTPPYHTFVVEQRDAIIALVVFVIVAVTVSVTVDLAARQRVAVSRSRLEAEILSRFTAEPIGDLSLVEVLDQIRRTFGMTSVALLECCEDDDKVAGIVGPPLQGHPAITVTAGPGLRLVAEGPELFAEDRRLLRRLAATAARAREGGQLAGAAAQARQLAEVDRLRAALLAAVSHELRTPLASVKAAVSSLRQRDITWTPAEQAEFLATIEESADRLDDLIANLLAMSRLQAGALSVAARPVALDAVVASALIGLHLPDVKVDVPDNLPLALADPGLLERVIANLVTNARRHATAGTPIRIDAIATAASPDADAIGDDTHGNGANGHDVGAGTVRLRVTDFGPGVPDTDWQRMFAPFQRLDERPTGGVGLGLAIARGFTEAMGGTITPSHTPGGGLTMTVTLPVTS